MAIDELINSLADAFPAQVECMELLQDALIKGDSRKAMEARSIISELLNSTPEYTRKLIGASRSDRGAARYVQVPGHIELISKHIGSLCEALKAASRDQVEMPGPALHECYYLFQRLREVLASSGDYLATSDPYAGGYIRECEISISQVVEDFQGRHAKRVKAGQCPARAAGLYTGALESFKGMAWHAREIVIEVSG